MPKIVKNEMVAHLWAAQTQPEARTSNNSMSFSGGALYSYAMQIGNIVNVGDISVILLNPSARNRSHTTNQHFTYALMASTQFVHRYIVPRISIWHNPESDHKINLEFLVTQYNVAVEKMMKATKSDYWNSQGRKALEIKRGEINGYSMIFDLEAPKIDFDADCAKIDARFIRLAALASDPKKVAARQRREAKRQAAKAEQERLEALSQLEKLTAWLNGENVKLPWQGFKTPQGGAYLRIKGETLETSLGAQVPLAEALEVVKTVDTLLTNQIKTAFEPRMRVGSFYVDKIHPNGDINAGCHFIEFAELMRMVKLLGFPFNAGISARMITYQLVEGR